MKWIVTVICLVLAVFILPVFISPVSRIHPEHKVAVDRAMKVVDAMASHYKEFGQWPAGGHADIIKALRGDNPKGIVFLDVPDEFVTSNGELADPWGTPYRLSVDQKTKRATVQSAGPDRRFQRPNEKRSDDVSSTSAAEGGIPGLAF